MSKLFWYLSTKPCAYCGDSRTSIELVIRSSGRVIQKKHFCTYKHLAAWWQQEYGEEIKDKLEKKEREN